MKQIDLEYEAMMRAEGSKLDGKDFLGTFPSVFAPLINQYCKTHEIDIFDRASIITKDGRILCSLLF